MKVDDATLLVLSGISDAILTSATVSQGSYYIVAIIVLVLFFFLFAIKTITEPIRRISQAANEADIANRSQIFRERGSVEIIALSRAQRHAKPHPGHGRITNAHAAGDWS
ncbi:hypothetical protein LP421_01300 (plasmid) [Rhizobium sp. RCAM05350]|nr:hypothetical protein LP421_01300 [Rhizobium sp. RCAM05350]